MMLKHPFGPSTNPGAHSYPTSLRQRRRACPRANTHETIRIAVISESSLSFPRQAR